METTTRERAILRVERDEVIPRPIDQVFARVADISHYSDWMSRRGVFKESTQCSEGPVGVGTTFIDEGRMGTFRGEVVEYEPPQHVAYREELRWFGVPVAEARAVYDLEPTSDGTAVHHVGESTLSGVFRFMKPMVGVIARGERRRTVDSLKRSFEGGK